MKTFLSLVMAICVCFGISAQEKDTLNQKTADTTSFSIGKKDISIIEKNGETDIKVKNREKNQDEVTEDIDAYEYEEKDNKNSYWHGRSEKHFKGHWDAFQIGINYYLSASQSTSLPDDISYMSLNTNKSINVNLNMFQQSFGLIGRNFGIMSGLGLEFTNYVFDGDNTIIKDPNGAGGGNGQTGAALDTG
jgi:hypothetical protein